MTAEITNALIKQIYRRSIRRLFLINLSNNIILFSIFGIFLFDFTLIIKSTSPNLSSNIILILLLSVPLLAIFKTIKGLPSIYYILATVDHKASTRGTFSLLNEISTKEPENKNLALLYDRSKEILNSLSIKTIFPWRLLWNGYFAAALAFTAVLWIAIPQHKTSGNNNSIPEQAPTGNDFSIKKDDQLISAFLNNKPTPKASEGISPSISDKKSIEQKNSADKDKFVVQNTNEQINSDKKFDDEKKKEDESINTASNNKNSGNGSGSEEVKTDKTTDIKEKTIADIKNNQKLNLTESTNQDGSSERVANQANKTKTTSENKLSTSAPTVKMQKLDNLSEMVSSKYQKIIENYFSEE